jgi:hypothetical protein
MLGQCITCLACAQVHRTEHSALQTNKRFPQTPQLLDRRSYPSRLQVGDLLAIWVGIQVAVHGVFRAILARE